MSSSRAPHATRINNNNTILRIELDDPTSRAALYAGKHPVYKPGDTISGIVSRTITPNIFHTSIKITATLVGRSTARIGMYTGGSSESWYENTFDILDGCVETLVLYSSDSGPLYENDGGGRDVDATAWPFAFTIPFAVRDVRSYAQHSESFFSSPDGSEGPMFVPPGNFALAECVADSYSGRTKASIAYAVEVNMERVFHGADPDPSESSKTQTARAAFGLESVSHSAPITNFGRKVETARRGVFSYKLVPGIEEPSLAQRARKAMMSAKVPGFAMQVRVGVPEFVQIGNPNVIPVTVSFEPVLETVSEILLGVPQAAMITALSIRLRPKTTTRADKTVVAHYDSRTVTKTGMGMAILPFTAIRDLKAISGQEIAVTVTPGGLVEPPLDLGAILDFRLREPDLHPTFCTYNIARRWEWDWELDFSIAGEAVRVGSVYEVVVLPRACEGVGFGPGPGPGPVSVGHEGDGIGERLPEYERDEELPAYSA